MAVGADHEFFVGGFKIRVGTVGSGQTNIMRIKVRATDNHRLRRDERHGKRKVKSGESDEAGP